MLHRKMKFKIKSKIRYKTDIIQVKYWLKLNKLRAVRKRVKFFMSYIRYIIFLLLFCCSYGNSNKNHGTIKRTNKAQTAQDRFGQHDPLP